MDKARRLDDVQARQIAAKLLGRVASKMPAIECVFEDVVPKRIWRSPVVWPWSLQGEEPAGAAGAVSEPGCGRYRARFGLPAACYSCSIHVLVSGTARQLQLIALRLWLFLGCLTCSRPCCPCSSSFARIKTNASAKRLWTSSFLRSVCLTKVWRVTSHTLFRYPLINQSYITQKHVCAPIVSQRVGTTGHFNVKYRWPKIEH